MFNNIYHSYSKNKILSLAFVLTCLLCPDAFPGEIPGQSKKQIDPPFLASTSHWVDSVFATLSLDEKIAQLITIAAYSNRGPDHVAHIDSLINNYKIGGVIFFQGGPVRQAYMTNHFQSLSKVPLLISMDAEWGLAMRLDSTLKYPYAMQLGAMDDQELIYKLSSDMARQLKSMGVHINYAPDIDINNNPLNPVISIRSFGEDRTAVTHNAIAMMLGLQDNHIIAVAKHFPGHGDTQTDSHLALPLLMVSRSRLDSLELYPFRHLIQAGVSGIMCAHLQIPALDTSANLPTSLSKPVITNLLRQEMKFKGLIFTDALTMKGVTDYCLPGALELKAFMAGNDVLVMSTDVPSTIMAIKQAIQDSLVPLSMVEASCRKILAAKEWVGLDHYKPISIDSLKQTLNPPDFDLLMRKATEKSLTLVWDPDSIIPLLNLDTLKIACLSYGVDSIPDLFHLSASLYTAVKIFKISANSSDSILRIIYNQLKDFNLVIAAVHGRSIKFANQFGLDLRFLQFIDTLALTKKTILALMANPYALHFFPHFSRFEAILLAYENSNYSQDYSAQLLFGGIPARGNLPVTINDILKVGKQRVYTGQIRLKYSIPEELGICSDSLAQIDSIVKRAINAGAMPGCQILAARNGIVFYRKSFGYLTYMQEQPVQENNLYDMASVTKVAATLPIIMKLYEQRKISLDGKMSAYLPVLISTNKANLLIKDILTHQAGLEAWIPFYLNTLKSLYKNQPVFNSYYSDDFPFRVEKNVYASRNLILNPKIYKSQPELGFSIHVADRLYMKDDYRDTIYRDIYNSPISKKKTYLYSDLAFLLFHQLAEKLTNQNEPSYDDQNFYAPLGMNYTLFNPLNKFEKSQIVPTENDVVFRKQLIQGYVHDPGAAMLGGVAGHAGLFSTSNDMAKYMQMLLWNGVYGGHTFFSQKTIETFTGCPFCKTGNRRGYGFDKPVIDGTPTGPVCPEVSLKSFGHTGFTGIIVWDDPDNQLLYIFLSNRVYPNQNNTKLTELNVRTDIQHVLYSAINSAKK
jgi:beta-N-acetylhexosaminidase